MSKQSVQDLLKLAESGNARAQYLFGRCKYSGRGIRKDVRGALEWLYRAVEGGHGKAAYLIVQIFREESYLPLEVERAAELERRLEEVNYPERLNMIADFADREHQERFVEAVLNEGIARYELKDFEAAAELLLLAASAGNKRAQFQIAEMYRNGEGFPRNADAALYWSETASSDKSLL